jgi:hypothetical protein
MRNERRGGLFIGKVCHQLLDKVVDVRWSLHIGLKGVSYVPGITQRVFKK